MNKRCIQCQNEFEQRRQRLLSMEDRESLYGGKELASIALGKDLIEANADMRHVAHWFEHPHPRGRDHRGEGDFAAIKLCRAHHLFAEKGLLEPATQESIRRFFLKNNFQSIYQSENHHFLFRTSRHLMGMVYESEEFEAFGGTGKSLANEDLAWLKQFIRYRARCGWGEFDSACYLAVDWECLCCLYDFAPDAELKKLAEMMMDLLLADIAVDSLDGMYGGAHGRIYPPMAMDHAMERTMPLQYLYFGLCDPTVPIFHPIDALTCSYRPHPLVLDIALNRTASYENRERKHLHNVTDILPEIPLQGSIRKYTFWTPDFVMGCVQFQDRYPNEPAGAAHYSRHQQHEWDLSFATRTDARLFTHHPGTYNEHNHWTGDMDCNCGHFFQNKSALIALYDVPECKPCQFINGYVPKAAFDEVIEEAGTIFVRAGKSGAALTLLPHYRWTEGEWQGCEVAGDQPRQAVVCEAGSLEDFGGFEGFRREIRGNEIQFDSSKMELGYHSKRAGALWLDTKGGRKLNGRAVDLDYAAFDSPFMQSAWSSGLIEITNGTKRLHLDFAAATRSESDLT